MRKISREMNERMRIKGKLLFARKNFASPVSRSQFYSLRKRKEWENSIESPMCNHPYFADKISREEFRRRGIRPLGAIYIVGLRRASPPQKISCKHGIKSPRESELPRVYPGCWLPYKHRPLNHPLISARFRTQVPFLLRM